MQNFNRYTSDVNLNNRNLMSHINGYDYPISNSGCESPAQSSTSSSKTRRKQKRKYYNSDDDDEFEVKKKRKQPVLCESLKAEIIDENDTIEDILDTRIGHQGHTGDMTTVYNYRPEQMPVTKSTERQYLIKWKNWSHIHATWESEESLKDRGTVEGMKKLEKFISEFREKERYKNSCTRDELEKVLFLENQRRDSNYEKMKVDRIIHEQFDKSGNKEYFIKWKSLDYRYVTAEESESVVKKLFKHAIDEFRQQSMKDKCPDVDTQYLRRRPIFRPIPENSTFGYSDTVLSLRDYQLVGVNWLLKLWTMGRNAILADEMGLGKTIQTVAFISVLFRRYKIYGPYLLIVPLSTINNWKKEFDLWAPECYTVVYSGDIQSREIIKKYELFRTGTRQIKFNVMLTTYEIAMNDKALLTSFYWVFMGIDEAHRLKSSESKLYKTIFPLRTNSRLLITGTPLQNNIKELWALLHFINPHEFDQFVDFEGKFGTAESESLCNAKLASLRETIQPFILRREKKDVEKSLPAKSEQILRISMSQRQKELYRLILAKNFESLLAETNKTTVFKNVIVELKKCCNHVELISDKMQSIPTWNERKDYLIRSSGKMIVLDKLLTHLKEEDHRVLIFSQMVRMLDILDDYLRLKGWGFQRLDGGVSSNLRDEAIKNFNSKRSTDFVFLLSTRAGGLGINLTSADTVIIFDSDWNPHADMQAMARAHRIGQTKQVSIYRFVVKSSVEEKIIERAKQKMVLDHLVIQRMESDGINAPNGVAKKKSTLETEDFEKILRFSAQEIFRDVDDDQDFNLETILKQAEVQNTEDKTSATSAFLSSFKVISLDTESLDNNNNIWGAEIATEAEAKSWNELIPKKYVDSIKKSDGNLINIIDGKETEVNSSQTNSRSVKKEAKTPATSSRINDSKSNSITPSTKIVKLNRLETRRLVQSMQKFGCPHKRAEKIISETQLFKLNEADCAKLIVDIIDKSKQHLSKYSSTSDNVPMEYNNYQIDVKYLMSRLELLEELHAVMVVYSDKERLHHQFLQTTKPTAWSCPWDARDDNHLLVGVYEYGMSAWRTIKGDPRFQLDNKVIPANPKSLPQVKHLNTRVHYLLEELKKRCKEPIKLKIKLPASNNIDKNKSKQSSVNNSNSSNTPKPSSSHKKPTNHYSPDPQSSDSDSSSSESSSSSNKHNSRHIKQEYTGPNSHKVQHTTDHKKKPYKYHNKNSSENDGNHSDNGDARSTYTTSSESSSSDSEDVLFDVEKILGKKLSDDRFLSCDGTMFTQCKSYMKKCKSDLAELQSVLMSTSDIINPSAGYRNMRRIGDYISFIVKDFDKDTKICFFRHLWNFVVIFCPNYTAIALYNIYKESKTAYQSTSHKPMR